MNVHVQADALQVATPPAHAPNPGRRRKQLLLALAGAVALAAAGVATYNVVFASGHVETDNAYVDADTAVVTSLTAGPVAEVRVDDTQAVRKGDVLVVLDDTDRRLDLQQAEAGLADVTRRVRGYQANNTALSGQIAARQADMARAGAELVRAQAEYDRRAPLAGSGAVSGEELTTVKAQLDAAQAGFAQAKANIQSAMGARESNNVLIEGVSLDQNPEVRAAQVRVDQARVNLDRTVVRAPIDGIVTKRQVQVGQMVAPGAPLMTVVPAQQAYVDANFKEVQLAKVRAGQPAKLTSDLYGDHVVYHGRVVGFSGGTGSSLAIVPTQNATGNWIKVVQRLPVRIALDPKELAAHPLKVGLSMNADIDVAP